MASSGELPDAIKKIIQADAGLTMPNELGKFYIELLKNGKRPWQIWENDLFLADWIQARFLDDIWGDGFVLPKDAGSRPFGQLQTLEATLKTRPAMDVTRKAPALAPPHLTALMSNVYRATGYEVSWTTDEEKNVHVTLPWTSSRYPLQLTWNKEDEPLDVQITLPNADVPEWKTRIADVNGDINDRVAHVLDAISKWVVFVLFKTRWKVRSRVDVFLDDVSVWKSGTIVNRYETPFSQYLRQKQQEKKKEDEKQQTWTLLAYEVVLDSMPNTKVIVPGLYIASPGAWTKNPDELYSPGDVMIHNLKDVNVSMLPPAPDAFGETKGLASTWLGTKADWTFQPLIEMQSTTPTHAQTIRTTFRNRAALIDPVWFRNPDVVKWIREAASRLIAPIAASGIDYLDTDGNELSRDSIKDPFQPGKPLTTDEKNAWLEVVRNGVTYPLLFNATSVLDIPAGRGHILPSFMLVSKVSEKAQGAAIVISYAETLDSASTEIGPLILSYDLEKLDSLQNVKELVALAARQLRTRLKTKTIREELTKLMKATAPSEAKKSADEIKYEKEVAELKSFGFGKAQDEPGKLVARILKANNGNTGQTRTFLAHRRYQFDPQLLIDSATKNKPFDEAAQLLLDHKNYDKDVASLLKMFPDEDPDVLLNLLNRTSGSLIASGPDAVDQVRKWLYPPDAELVKLNAWNASRNFTDGVLLGALTKYGNAQGVMKNLV